jgi:hypothetical protein
VVPNHKSRRLKGRSAGPTPWLAGQTLSRFRSRLGGYVHTLVQRRILCSIVGGNLEEWLADHVDGHPAVHHLQINLVKSVEAPLYPYIRIPMIEFTHTTIFL